MVIKVKDSEEFRRLIEELADDVVDAHIHYSLYKDLTSTLEQHPLVYAQSRAF